MSREIERETKGGEGGLESERKKFLLCGELFHSRLRTGYVFPCFSVLCLRCALSYLRRRFLESADYKSVLLYA